MISPSLIALALSSSSPAEAPAPAPAPDTEMALLTSLVASGVSHEAGFDVVASADVRKQLELEGTRQLSGCSTAATSCLAEVAGALGARLVVSGTVGQLGGAYVLTLNLFDSNDGSAPGRVVVREASVDALTNRVEGATHELLAPFIAAHPAAPDKAEPKMKLLVLDLDGDLGAPPPPPPKEPGVSMPGVVSLAAGGGLALVGGVLFVVSGIADQTATAEKTTQVEANDAYNLRDGTGWGGVACVAAGVVSAAVGGILIAVGE